MTTTTVSPADDLWHAVRNAAAGDVLQLASGSYGDFRMDSFSIPAPGLTIKAAPGAAPVFSSFTGYGLSGVNFSGVEFLLPGDTQGLLINGGERITVDGCKFHGQPVKPAQGSGIALRGCGAGCGITNSQFYDIGVGISQSDTPGTVISLNTFRNIATDGIDSGGCQAPIITGNTFTDFFPEAGAHPDAIQFWATAANPLPAGAIVKDNVITRGTGQVMQGIFCEFQAAMTIVGNAMSGTMYNGISLSGCQGASVSGNFVQGWSDMGSRIIVRGSSDVTVGPNSVSEAVINLPGNASASPPEPDNLNLTILAQGFIPQAAVGDVSALNAWLAAKGSTPVPAPAPPPPVPVPPAPPPAPAPPVTPPVVVDSRDALIAKLKAALTKVIALGTAANAKRQGPTKADMAGVIATAKTAVAP